MPGTQEEGAAPTWTGGLWVDAPGLPDLLGLQGGPDFPVGGQHPLICLKTVPRPVAYKTPFITLGTPHFLGTRPIIKVQ